MLHRSGLFVADCFIAMDKQILQKNHKSRYRVTCLHEKFKFPPCGANSRISDRHQIGEVLGCSDQVLACVQPPALLKRAAVHRLIRFHLDFLRRLVCPWNTFFSLFSLSVFLGCAHDITIVCCDNCLVKG